jgi:hypothetical protein
MSFLNREPFSTMRGSLYTSDRRKEELKMNRRSVVAAMVIGASMLASEAMYAAPAAIRSPVHAMFGTGLVKFNLRNTTDSPIKIKAGEMEMLLPPGKDVPVKLPVGVKIVVEEASTHFVAGSIILTVYPELGDTTVSVK